MKAAATEIAARFADVVPRPPTPFDLDQLRKRLVDAVSAGSFDGITSRDWKRSPWVFWLGGPACLARDSRLQNRYEDFLQSRSGTGAIKTLIHAYLRDFAPDLPGIDWVSRLIREHLRDDPRDLLEIWRRRDREYTLFDREQAPQTLAAAGLSPPASPQQMLQNAGLTGGLEFGGLARITWQSAVERLRQEFRNGRQPQNTLERVIQWSSGTNGGLRYPDLKARLAEALLLPWTQAAPISVIKERIQAFLLQALKDPRIYHGHWHGISDDAVAVMRRWLVGATLRAYFEVLDRNSEHYPENHRKHWRYRRTFWWAYYEKQALPEAWFAFAPEAERLARPVLAQVHGHLLRPEERTYGTIGVSGNHVVLLMRIGGLTIVEWSHVGKCRIWRQGDPRAPRLYEKRYTRAQLTSGSEIIVESYQEPGITHFSSESRGWQEKVADFIYRHTNIRVSAQEYMPRE